MCRLSLLGCTTEDKRPSLQFRRTISRSILLQLRESLEQPRRTSSSRMSLLLFTTIQPSLRGTTTVSSISSNVVTVAATPSSTDADDVILPTISSAAVSTLSPISMKNSKVYMAASGTSSASLFASGNQVTVQSADVTINRDIQTPGLQDLTGSVYPSADYIVGNDVSITGSFTLNAQPNQLSAASRFVDQDLMAIGIQVDNGSDQFIRFFMPYSA